MIFKEENKIEKIERMFCYVKDYIRMQNKRNRKDAAIAAEDFICGILNLIYNYNFVNENKFNKNAVAIDLVDREKKVAVQVTSDCRKDKITKTIQKFIKSELYKEFDTLLIVFLNDKPSLNKSYDTNDKFTFQPHDHVLDVNDLIQKISQLDNEKVQEIADYMKKSLNMPKDFSWLIVALIQYVKKSRCAIIALCIFVILVIIIFLGFQPQNIQTESELNAEVYHSYIFPYVFAGRHDTPNDIYGFQDAEIKADRAFSILGFIRNYGNKPSVVESVYSDIISLDPIEEPVLSLDAAITGNKLRLFVFNNGWGKSDSLTVTKAIFTHGTGSCSKLENLCKSVNYEPNTGILSANAGLLAEYHIDTEKFQKYCDDYSLYLPIEIEAVEKNITLSWMAYLSYNNGQFFVSYGGKDGDEEYNVTLFETLDVDARPSAVAFTELDKIPPLIDDYLRLETVLAPTKSCVVTCCNVYYINGKKQQTPPFTAVVTVPAFQENAICLTGALTEKLAQLQNPDASQINRIIGKYFYHPESVREESQEFLDND